MSRTFRRRDPNRPRRLRVDPVCKAKRRYSDEVTARALAQVSMREVGNRQRLWVYKCRHCFGFHLTHRDQGRAHLVLAEEGEPVAD